MSFRRMIPVLLTALTPRGIAQTVILVVLGVGLMAQGCGDNGVSKPEEGPQEIFPLSLGTKWIYGYARFPDTTMSRVEADSVCVSRLVGGEVYHEICGTAFVLPHGPALVRMNEEDQLVVVDQESGDEQVFLDFGGPMGNEWVYSVPAERDTLEFKMTMRSMIDTVYSAAGVFTDCYRFIMDPMFYTTHMCADQIVVAPGIGVVYFSRCLRSTSFLIEYGKGEGE